MAVASGQCSTRGTLIILQLLTSVLHLQTVNPQRLTTLLGGILEPDHLALIYDTLARHQQRSKGSTEEIEKIKLYMQALRRIPRWQMTETLLLPNERKMGEEVWNSCNK